MKDSLRSEVVLLEQTNGDILSHSGKQLRPILSLLVARLCSPGGIHPDAVRIAAASELLHNATLLHDDVADGSEQRRGEPTVWSRMGAAPAVLIGDFWLARTVEILLSTSHRDSVAKYYSRTLSNLAEGEMLQMEKAASADTTEEDYYRIIYCKTASLFEAAIVGAALCSDASQEVIDACIRYSKALGLAFQIKDDILDYCGKDAMGKPSGVDLREKKITLPLLGALKSSGEAPRYREMLKTIDKEPGNISLLHDFVIRQGGLEYAQSRLAEFVEEAVSALDVFEDSQEKTYLAEIARYNLLREL